MNEETPSDDSAEPVDSEAPDRGVESAGAELEPRLSFPVIGIGASAGGLEAFVQFFRAMPATSGMAFVLIQHLPPERESVMAEILSKHTTMPVLQVTDQMPVEANHVYIIRPGRTMTIRDGLLCLGAPVEKPGHRRPVDDFFRSLAEEQRERAIAIILSGMGSNGSAGAQQVKAVGGIVIAQDPETAKFSSMPRNAIESGHADFVLRAEEMPDHLIRYCQHPYPRGESIAKDSLAPDRMVVGEILSILRARTRLDFTGYKKPTLLRRVQRRMGIHELTDMGEYARLLRQNTAEATALSDDLMIHVTGFFRDPEVWEALREKIIMPLVADRAAESTIRAWVTACSSGEEAYTLGMLLIEAAEAIGKNFDLKIFATDTADRSLSLARSGVYPGGIESEVSPERLERFFDRNDSVYRIKKKLREIVVFAPQNILQDPPFSRLDICTCRNLLIYLEPEVQQRALAMMHFGLREGGALLLGTSETITGLEDRYETLDKKHRIYRRVGSVRQGSLEFSRAPVFFAPSDTDVNRAHPLARASFTQMTHRLLLENFCPASVVIDRQHRIVYFHGHTERYLDQPRGEPTREISLLARDFVRTTVRSAIHRALAEEGAVQIRDGVRETPNGRWRVTVSVIPLEAQKPAPHFLVTFEEHSEEALLLPNNASPAEQRELEQELKRTKDELQRAVEELQSINEELKASNEEATSINEELQSINEELETSKEELQSLNEELTTVNARLQAKMNELEATTSDLSSLLSSTNIAVIFLDLNFRIRRFTPPVQDLFDLIPSDVGRPLRDLARKFADPDLLRDAQEALEKLAQREKDITSESGRIYLRRVLPYRTIDHRITGVMITFVDIGDQKMAEAELRQAEARDRLILEGVREYAIFLVDTSGRIATWPMGAERIIGYNGSEALGRPLSLIATPEDQASGRTEKELLEAATKGSVNEDHWHQRKDGSRFFGSGMLHALKDGQTLTGYVKVLRDNTDRKHAEERLLEAKRAAEEANAAKDQFLATVSHELRTPLSAMMLWTKLLREQDDVPPSMNEGLSAIEKCAVEQQALIEDIVDTSRIVMGKLRLEAKPMDLVAMVKSAVETVRPAALLKLVTVTETYVPGIGLVTADPNRLHQVVWNLMTNAVKFTPSGGFVKVRLERKGDEVELEVRDNGSGISPDLLPRIFDRFRQGDNATTRSHSGLGLGLSIVRQLVELHRGSVKAASDGLHRGTTFTVKLPLPALPPEIARAVDSVSPVEGKVDLTGLRVLLVEDAVETRQALVALLRKSGATVAEAETAGVALEQLKIQRPDVLVSDVGLPEMDGHELIHRVREYEKSKGLPPMLALALTAFADEANQQKAIASGFHRCLTKPIDTPKLLGILSKAKPGH